jgi:hypothetical protein
MSFLEELGRSGALDQAIGNYQATSRQIRQDREAAADKKVKDERETLQFNLQQRQGAAEVAVQEAQVEKIEAEKARRSQMKPIDAVLDSLGMVGTLPSVREQLLKAAGERIKKFDLGEGQVAEGISQGDIEDLMEDFRNNKQFQRILDEKGLVDLTQKKIQIKQQLNNPEAKLKPEQVEQLKSELTEIDSFIGQIMSSLTGFDKDAQEQKLKEEKLEVEIGKLEVQTKAELAGLGKTDAEIEKLRAEAEKNRAQGRAAGRIAEPKTTQFERAYKQFKEQPGNEKITMAEFKTKHWEAKGSAPSGGLSDAAALQNIRDLAGSEAEAKKLFSAYVQKRKQGMSGTEAYEEVTSESQGVPTIINEDGEEVIDFNALLGD